MTAPTRRGPAPAGQPSVLSAARNAPTTDHRTDHRNDARGTIAWSEVLEVGRRIVDEAEVGMTLRQLHYRLVSTPTLGYPNTQAAYKGLSSRSAKARREGTFPALIDRTRRVERPPSWDGPGAALGALTRQYRRDRTAGQTVALYLGVEKAGILTQLSAWFAGLGVGIFATGGYTSQTFADELPAEVRADGRPAVLVYAGDFDPSGEDISRDFVERTGCWSHVDRVALTAAQVDEYDLPPEPGKAGDSRAAAFVARHGRLMQVEVDALPVDVLRQLYADAIARWWDDEVHQEVLELEQADRSTLAALAGEVGR